MLKFDPKFFDRTSLNKIYDAVTTAGMLEQVLLRVGDTALKNAKADGYDTRMIMPRYHNMPLAAEIITLAATYDIRAISVPRSDNPDTLEFDPEPLDSEMLDAANDADLIFEIHELNGMTDQDKEDAISLGVRQFHSFTPTSLLDYLEQNGHREF